MARTLIENLRTLLVRRSCYEDEKTNHDVMGHDSASWMTATQSENQKLEKTR